MAFLRFCGRPQSLTPRALAAASAALVLSLIMRFFFSDHRHDADSQPIGVRHVGRSEGDARSLQSEQKMRVTRQAVEFSDDQRRLATLHSRNAAASYGRPE